MGMADDYDVIVIGSGLGGLTAAGLIAQAGRKTLLIERNHDVGGAASTYKAGGLVVEASLHVAADEQQGHRPTAAKKIEPMAEPHMPGTQKPVAPVTNLEA
jgi:pyruvate/2-oxoglutarate dehydrogenase complex dihydrolipoamide dehydrogenase (E3) component